MYDSLPIKVIDLKDIYEKKKVESFLNKFDLNLDNDVDYTIVMEDSSNGNIVATCSKASSVLKCFAVDDTLRGEGITSVLISHMIDKCFEKGIYHNFIFTKPDKIQVFTSLNFKLLYKTEKAALLENGIYNIDTYLDNIISKYDIDISTEKCALVMNCNPFTLGHRYLIEQASNNNKSVIVFVLEEEKSTFPFSVRYDLVKNGTSDLKNVIVIPGGEYIISSATFPSYFIKEADARLKAYTQIDAGIFGKYISRKLNIKRRYVGNEPFCEVTNCYNETLKQELQKYGVELVEVERKKEDGRPISASFVRKLLQESRISEVKKFVPEITYRFLNTNEGKMIGVKSENE